MYNADLKTQFIRSYTESVSTANAVRDMFNYIEPVEKKYDTDVACMTTDQAVEAISTLQSLRASSMEYRIAALRAYVNWNISVGTAGVNKDVSLVEPKGFDHIRHMMIKDPTHLSSILNKVFAPVNENTMENIYRFYLWMHYAGMNDEQILSCRKQDIDYKRMEIVVDGHSFPIYRECLDVVSFCADAEEIAERHKLMMDIRDTATRYPGDELYRGARKTTNKNSARVIIFQFLQNAYNDGIIDVKISRRVLHLSGIFYRMYEREMNGFPVDFTEDATNEMQGRTYKVNESFTINVKRKRIMRDFEEDYVNWKNAFYL